MRRKLLEALFWNSWTPIAVACAVMAIDFSCGPHIRFPATFAIPVAWLSWHQSRHRSLAAAIIMPALRFGFYQTWYQENDTLPYEIINSSIQCSVLVLISVLVAKVARHQQLLEREVKVLAGHLPVCRFCNKIQDSSGRWQEMEDYIARNSEAKVSMTFCPDCGREKYGDIVDLED